MAVGIGGGHTGFTVCALHLLNADDPEHLVFIDTPKPESDQASFGGFFRQSWGTREESDIIALLNNIYYAYHRARIVVAEDLLADQGVNFEVPSGAGMQRADDPETFAELRGMSEAMAAYWGAMDVTADEDRRQEMAQRYGSQLMLDINRYQKLLDKLGIQETYAD